MSPALADALAALPGLAAQHLLLSLAALAVGSAIGLPLAVAAARRPLLRSVATGLAGLVQTIPGLALLALFFPLLLGIGRATGLALPALGFLPALLALALYALLPVLRTAVTALVGVAPGALEAADALGMTAWQRLRLVELPLAAPVIMAGVRTAGTWTVGAATLATTVGQPCLGNLIFAGLQTEDWVAVLVGCAGAAALALGLDGLLALVEAGLRRRRPALAWGGVAGLALAILLVALPRPGPSRGETTAVIGAKTFSEQYILADLIADRLRTAGFATSRRDDLGSAVAYRALAGGSIDAYVDYSGTLWANVLGRHDNPPPALLRADLTRALQRRDGVLVVGPLGFENAYALAMRRSRADALGIRTLDDLARRAPGLKLGADLEFLGRPEWAAVRSAYRLRFAGTAAYSPTFMYRALASGQADVISAFSSDGRIAADDLVLLSDPRHALPSYDALLLVSPARAHDRRFVAALQPLVGSLPVARMRAANLQVDRADDKRTPEQAALWLERNGAVQNAATRP